MYWQECYERVGRWVALRQVEDGSEKGMRWVDEMNRWLGRGWWIEHALGRLVYGEQSKNDG